MLKTQWENEISSVQDAVTLCILNNIEEASQKGINLDTIKWRGVTCTNTESAEGESIGSEVKFMISVDENKEYYVDRILFIINATIYSIII